MIGLPVYQTRHASLLSSARTHLGSNHEPAALRLSLDPESAWPREGSLGPSAHPLPDSSSVPVAVDGRPAFGTGTHGDNERTVGFEDDAGATLPGRVNFNGKKTKSSSSPRTAISQWSGDLI